jgi:MFS-type transporter involved in bile tolerance (Atg22 family)
MSQNPPTIPNQPMERVYRPLSALLVANFLSGIAWGLGSVIGATVVVAVIGILIAQSSQLPLLGKLIELTMAEVEKTQLNMQFQQD